MKHRLGMALVEIMVVLVIITLISTAVAVGAMQQAAKARERVALNDMRAILNALDLYKVQRGRYPAPTPSLSELKKDLGLKSITDPWGGEYVYLLEQGEPVIVTHGADGQVGGDGEDRDLSSRELGGSET